MNVKISVVFVVFVIEGVVSIYYYGEFFDGLSLFDNIFYDIGFIIKMYVGLILV